MRAGKLRHRIEIQQRQDDRDPAGQPVDGWVTVCKPWADVRYLNGRQFIGSDAETNADGVSIRIRRRTDVTADMRVLFRQSYFDILAVLPDEDDLEYVDLACSTGASNG